MNPTGLPKTQNMLALLVVGLPRQLHFLLYEHTKTFVARNNLRLLFIAYSQLYFRAKFVELFRDRHLVVATNRICLQSRVKTRKFAI